MNRKNAYLENNINTCWCLLIIWNPIYDLWSIHSFITLPPTNRNMIIFVIIGNFVFIKSNDEYLQRHSCFSLQIHTNKTLSLYVGQTILLYANHLKSCLGLTDKHSCTNKKQTMHSEYKGMKFYSNPAIHVTTHIYANGWLCWQVSWVVLSSWPIFWICNYRCIARWFYSCVSNK